MEINRRFQDRFIQGAAEGWLPVEAVERDICLLYHQLSNFANVEPSVCCGLVFDLPYWEYLNIPEISEEDRVFIRDGCLVIILGVCLAQIEGWLSWENLSEAQEAVKRLHADDERGQQLIVGVLLALQEAQEPFHHRHDEELSQLSEWAHKQFVREYFRKTVREFDTNPYFGE